MRRLCPFRLALGTEMGRAPGQQHFLDRGLAARTRRASLAVDAEFMLELPLQPGAANVIANAGATFLDGPAQDGDDGMLQLAGLSRRQFPAEGCRMQLRFEERFVGIDVAD